MSNDALFCVGQKAFIEKDGKVLILHDPVEGLDFPGGKIQEGEARDGDVSSLALSLQREVREETGLDIRILEPFTVWYHEYSRGSRNYGKVVYLVGFACLYISGEVILSDEHDRFVWVDRANYRDFDDRSDYFAALAAYFESYVHGTLGIAHTPDNSR